MTTPERHPESDSIARRAAGRLQGELDANLPAWTEQAVGAEAAAPEAAAIDTVPAATLLLEMAEAAWEVWREIGADDGAALGEAQATELLERRLRLELDRPAEVSAGDRDLMIQAVVAETVRKDL